MNLQSKFKLIKLWLIKVLPVCKAGFRGKKWKVNKEACGALEDVRIYLNDWWSTWAITRRVKIRWCRSTMVIFCYAIVWLNLVICYKLIVLVLRNTIFICRLTLTRKVINNGFTSECATCAKIRSTNFTLWTSQNLVSPADQDNANLHSTSASSISLKWANTTSGSRLGQIVYNMSKQRSPAAERTSWQRVLTQIKMKRSRRCLVKRRPLNLWVKHRIIFKMKILAKFQ